MPFLAQSLLLRAEVRWVAGADLSHDEYQQTGQLRVGEARAFRLPTLLL